MNIIKAWSGKGIVKEIVLFQNHPQRYEKLICFHSYTATTNEKFVGSSGI